MSATHFDGLPLPKQTEPSSHASDLRRQKYPPQAGGQPCPPNLSVISVSRFPGRSPSPRTGLEVFVLLHSGVPPAAGFGKRHCICAGVDADRRPVPGGCMRFAPTFPPHNSDPRRGHARHAALSRRLVRQVYWLRKAALRMELECRLPAIYDHPPTTTAAASYRCLAGEALTVSCVAYVLQGCHDGTYNGTYTRSCAEEQRLASSF